MRGSLTVGMILSSADMQKHLRSIDHLFDQNSTSLFQDRTEGYGRIDRLGQKKISTYPELDRLPKHLKDLARSFISFRICLGDFSDRKDEKLNRSIRIVITDLKV